MKKLLFILFWIGLVYIAFLWTPTYSADLIVVNGKIGTVITDKITVYDSDYYTSVKGISTEIGMGIAIYKAWKSAKDKSYIDYPKMSQEDRFASNASRAKTMLSKLQAWGFKDDWDLIEKAKIAYSKAGLDPAGWWK